MCLVQVKAVQKPLKCHLIHLQNLFLRLRPAEDICLKPFQPNAKSVFLPIQDFHQIPSSVTKSKQTTRKQIQPELILDKKRQAINRFPHVGGAQGNIHPGSRWLENHDGFRTDNSFLSAGIEKSSASSNRNSFLAKIIVKPAGCKLDSLASSGRTARG